MVHDSNDEFLGEKDARYDGAVEKVWIGMEYGPNIEWTSDRQKSWRRMGSKRWKRRLEQLTPFQLDGKCDRL